MNAKKSETGTRYNFTRTMLQKFIKDKSLNIPNVIAPKYAKINGRNQLAYWLTIATDNPQAVESYIREKFLADIDTKDYTIEYFNTRLQNSELRQIYPVTVQLRVSTYINFSFRDIVTNVSGKHYMSHTYNSGMLPCAILRYEIPEKYQDLRRKAFAEIKQRPQPFDIKLYSEWDFELLKKIWIEDQIEHLTIYLDYPERHDLNDMSVSLGLSPSAVLFRERPLLPKVKVEVVDCVPFSNSLIYQPRCGFRNTSTPDASEKQKQNSMRSWVEFVHNRTMIRRGSTLDQISSNPNMLIQILKLTLPEDYNKSVTILSSRLKDSPADGVELRF